MLAVAFVFFSQGWIGGGDAKLAAATALWFGFAYLLDYLLYASIFGGVLTLALLQFRKLPLPGVLTRQAWIMRLHDSAGDVPYGISARRRCARGLSQNRLDARLRALRAGVVSEAIQY